MRRAAPPISSAVEQVSISDPARGQYTHAFSANDEGLQEHGEEAINFDGNGQCADNGEDESPGGVLPS